MANKPAELTLKVQRLTTDGLGETLVPNDQGLPPRTVLMRNALPDETVEVRVLKRRKGIWYAESADEPIALPFSDMRRSCACAHFPRCGGCSLHHMKAHDALQLKLSQLQQALAEHNIVPSHWRAPVRANQLGYRHKARLGVRCVGDNVFVGFRESFSNRVARLDACVVLTPQLSALIAPLKKLIAQLSIATKIPQIEFAQGDGVPVLMVRHLLPLSAEDLLLWQNFELQHGVSVLLQSGGYDTLQTLDGQAPARLGYQLPDWGLHIQFMPQQFIQVNLEMNQVLIRYVLALLGEIKGQRVADLFCGVGNFTLPLARLGAQVWGYEVATDAVQMAQDNARHNGLTQRVSFAALDLYTDSEAAVLPVQVDALVLDPPRSGAGPNLPRWLAEFRGDRVVYVSCNPKTFASDAVHLRAAGFELETVGIFDMFPNTTHVETIGRFRRTGECSNG
ncbi:MAG: 23S rRNA (uracil(1939)-C(5))-methyltransferase RlmD [bacterium]